MRNKLSAIFFLTVLCILFGFLIMTQYQNYQSSLSSLSNQEIPNLVLILQDLNEKRLDLSAQKEELTDSYHFVDQSYDSESDLIDALNQQRKALTISAGTTGLKSEGLILSIKDSGDLSGTDMVDLINELWGAGAVALSINDLRIGTQSVITAKGTKSGIHFFLNETPLTFPLEIKALGNSETMEAALTFPGGIGETLQATANITLEITPQEELEVPPVS